MKRIIVQKYVDPNHAWYKVPRSVLVKLKIADKITPCSYESKGGSMVYLEEDLDYSTFYAAAREAKLKMEFRRIRYSSKPSRIRNLLSYRHLYYHVLINESKMTIREALNSVETFVRQSRPDFRVPRPSQDYPWNWQTYLSVKDQLKDRLQVMGLGYVYYDKNANLIVTNNWSKARKDILQTNPKIETIVVK
jgi:hypothetical protein